MLSDEFLNQIFRNNQEKIDRKISYEYHKILKLIKGQKNEERENIVSWANKYFDLFEAIKQGEKDV